MAWPSGMQVALQGVLLRTGDVWQSRPLTSALDAEARAYGSWVPFTAQRVQRLLGDEYDERRGGIVQRERIVLKTLDSVALNVGDEVKDPNGVYYHVDGLDDAMSGDGLLRYRCSRQVPKLGQADRGGGI